MTRRWLGATVFWLVFFAWVFLASFGKAQADCILSTRIHIVETHKVDTVCHDMFNVAGTTVPVDTEFEWCSHGEGVIVVPEHLHPYVLYPPLMRLIESQCPEHALGMRLKQLEKDRLEQEEDESPLKEKKRKVDFRPGTKIEVNKEEESPMMILNDEGVAKKKKRKKRS